MRACAQNKEHEAKEELKRRAKQLEVQRREMTRRGQNPYASNSSSGFAQQNNSYQPSAPSSYDQPPSRYSGLEERAAPAQSKPFKTKGMQLGASKGKKNDSTLAEALGGLNVEDEPLLSHRVEESYQQQQQQQYQQAEAYGRASPAQAPTPTKDVNPFGEVEQAE